MYLHYKRKNSLCFSSGWRGIWNGTLAVSMGAHSFWQLQALSCNPPSPNFPAIKMHPSTLSVGFLFHSPLYVHVLCCVKMSAFCKNNQHISQWSCLSLIISMETMIQIVSQNGQCLESHCMHVWGWGWGWISIFNMCVCVQRSEVYFCIIPISCPSSLLRWGLSLPILARVAAQQAPCCEAYPVCAPSNKVGIRDTHCSFQMFLFTYLITHFCWVLGLSSGLHSCTAPSNHTKLT